MVWLRNLPKYLNIWLVNLLTTSTAPKTLLNRSKNVTLLPGECVNSYDVTALFTSVPVNPAFGIIRDLLEKHPTFKEKTVMSVGDIVLLLEFCLKNTYFLSKGSSMNRLMVWLWVPHSGPLWLTYIWSTLSKKLYVLAPPTR